MSRRATALLLLGALILGVTLPAAPSSAATVRRILFVRAGDIYSISPNGTGVTRLTTTGNNGQPAWSPDSSRIAFVSSRDGDMEIFSMGAAGGSVRKLTNNARIDTHPAWSPDSRSIAFIRDFRFVRYDVDPEVGAELWLMNRDGTAQRRFQLGEGAAFDGFHEEIWDPAWSPDGAYIAGTGIEWMPTQDFALWVRDLAGDAVLVVEGHYWTPAWAPNGDAIACTYDGLYRVPINDPDARTQLMSTSENRECSFPSMSGGSRFVAYVDGGVLRGRSLETGRDVALAIIARYGYGNGRAYCGSGCWAVRHPYDWSPDGRLMVAATGDGLRVVSPDASYTRVLPVVGSDPSW